MFKAISIYIFSIPPLIIDKMPQWEVGISLFETLCWFSVYKAIRLGMETKAKRV